MASSEFLNWTLKHGRKKLTEGHALAYLKYVTIATYDLR